MAQLEPSDQAAARSLVAEIRSPRTGFSRLLAIWRSQPRPQEGLRFPIEAYQALGRRMIADAAPLHALEVTREGLEVEPDHLWLRQVRGLALARIGETELARQTLKSLAADLERSGAPDRHLLEEVLAGWARTEKDLGLFSGDLNHQALVAARELYARSFELTGGYWSGVNVATLSTITGDHARAARVAATVARQCEHGLEGVSGEERFWMLATLGEAKLTLGDLDAAELWYRRAREAVGSSFGNLLTARRQAGLLLTHLGHDAPRLLQQWLPSPKVAVFAGHMVDQPGRPEPRLPEQHAATVGAAIKRRLQSQDISVGFSSAACGSDILFQEALLEVGAERHVILPYEPEQFAVDSVTVAGDPDWKPRFERVLGSDARVVVAGTASAEAGALPYDYANALLHGLAVDRAQDLDTDLVGLAVWDGRPGDGPGGTASVVHRWRAAGLEFSIIEVSRLPETGSIRVVPQTTLAPRRTAVSTPGSISALLFADVQHFSRFSDDEMVSFVEQFWTRLRTLLNEHQGSIRAVRTWGDALFAAFDSVDAAGRFALAMKQIVEQTDWPAKGLPQDLAVRIALHAGPVHLYTDPVTNAPDCTGIHVTRAARLEPETPPGSVYATEAFAAFTALHETEAFRCHYVGHLRWAKDYGAHPAYVVLPVD